MCEKERQNGTESCRIEVGKIDTRKPFQSVKDAIMFFSDERTFSKTQPDFAEIIRLGQVVRRTRGAGGCSERSVSHQPVPDLVLDVQQNKTPYQLSSSSSLANDGGVSEVRTRTLRVNQFPVSFNPDTIIKHHEVDVKLEVGPKNGRERIKKLDLMKIKDKLFGGNSSEFPLGIDKTGDDGEKNTFSAVSLPTGAFKVDLDEGGDLIKNAEMVKMQVQEEVEEAKRAEDDLVRKLKTVNESKALEVKPLEDANGLQIEEQTSKVKAEKVGQSMAEDVIANLQVGQESFVDEEDANCLQIEEQSSKVKAEEVGQSMEQDVIANLEVGQESFIEKDLERQSDRDTLKGSGNLLFEFQKESDTKLAQNLPKQIERARETDVDSVSDVISVVKAAKESLKRVAEEKTSLWNLVESLKLESEALKKENSELKERAVESETIRGNLLVKLRKSTYELEAARSRDSKARHSSVKINSTIQQLQIEAKLAKKKAREMSELVEGLKKEAAATKSALVEAENKVRVSIQVVETAALLLEESENKVKADETALRILAETRKSSEASADHWIRRSWKAVKRPVLKKLMCVCGRPGL